MPGLESLALSRARRDGARASARHRRHDAWLLALGLVAGALSDRRPRQYRAEIDALAIRQGGGKFQRIDQSASNSRRPTTTIASARLSPLLCPDAGPHEIERATGALRIAKAYSVLECGEALVPEARAVDIRRAASQPGVGYALLESAAACVPPKKKKKREEGRGDWPGQRAMEYGAGPDCAAGWIRLPATSRIESRCRRDWPKSCRRNWRGGLVMVSRGAGAPEREFPYATGQAI